MKIKLKTPFKVHEFIKLMGNDLDYCFSTSNETEGFLLLNLSELGELDAEGINKLKAGSALVIINNDTMEMETFNIDEDVLMTALMTMS